MVKACDELEAAGVIYKKRGSGCFVSPEQSKLAEKEKRKILEQLMDDLLAQAHQLNYSNEDLFKLLQNLCLVIVGFYMLFLLTLWSYDTLRHN